MTKDVLVITGPTATGKTELGVKMAQELDGEIVSADSMQVYKYMDVGTAKPAKEEMCGIPHHMIDVASPFERYSVAMYVEAAARCCDDILSRKKVPIIVGGTGLYIESLILGRDFAPMDEESPLRRQLEEEYDRLGGEEMLKILSEKDPVRAQKLHPNDKKRIVRALESCASGVSITDHDAKTQQTPPRYNAKIVVLGYEERERLYAGINRRVDVMMEKGLVSEVEKLLGMGLTEGHTAMQAIGYKEIIAALRGETSLDEAAELVKQGSRRYAKRQISWCTRYKDALRINWEEKPNMSRAVQASTFFFRERG